MYREKYLKYKRKYLDLKGAGWRKKLTEDEQADILDYIKGIPKDERAAAKNKLASAIRERKNQARKLAKADASRAASSGAAAAGAGSGSSSGSGSGSGSSSSSSSGSSSGMTAAGAAQRRRDITIMGLDGVEGGGAPALTPRQIKVAYMRLALLHHPDKTGGDDSTIKAINNAYQRLIENNYNY
jgi:hypothetical protein